ncbi:polysaccharide biosynthesis/export family protein [Cesiribacter sp. SM1]|uniref:polysaccharide biosynthesis/export family protein n=1 Tax=Cesiribacter sp. SM1 TaxID=2861196 RepID=UPI001CD78A51|nr:polysaccharide biosynthesis/export family protein [Cesiribacter sp. SM1]
MDFYSKSSVYLCLLVLLLLGSACVPNKKLVYFSDPKYNTETLTPITNQPGAYKLQSRDILSVRIKTLDTESSDYFNIQPENSFFNINQASVYLNSYSIDDNGSITLPEVGPLQVAGLTVPEAQQKIQEAFSVYLNKATILVKLVSFKITILGEVRNPGHFYIYNNQLTVLEGLGMAGDLTDFGNRENITLLRQTDTGVGAVVVDLKNPQLLSSEFYYLQPNDVLYVQPLKAKATRGNLNTLNVLSVIFGAVSTAILVLNYVN